jgi:hypothetical protein
MRGIPLLRLLLLALFLSGATLLVARLAGPSTAEKPSLAPPVSMTKTHQVASFVEATLSAPAKSVVLSWKDPHLPPTLKWEPGAEAPARAFESDLKLALTPDGSTQDRVTVLWLDPSQSNFLLLTLEPEGLATKTITLHFPPTVTTLPLDLHWPNFIARPDSP